MSAASSESSGPKRRNILVLLPLLAFLALAALFYVRLGAGDTSHIPSALIGQPAPRPTCRHWPDSSATARRCRA